MANPAFQLLNPKNPGFFPLLLISSDPIPNPLVIPAQLHLYYIPQRQSNHSSLPPSQCHPGFKLPSFSAGLPISPHYLPAPHLEFLPQIYAAQLFKLFSLTTLFLQWCPILLKIKLKVLSTHTKGLQGPHCHPNLIFQCLPPPPDTRASLLLPILANTLRRHSFAFKFQMSPYPGGLF